MTNFRRLSVVTINLKWYQMSIYPTPGRTNYKMVSRRTNHLTHVREKFQVSVPLSPGLFLFLFLFFDSRDRIIVPLPYYICGLGVQ